MRILDNITFIVDGELVSPDGVERLFGKASSCLRELNSERFFFWDSKGFGRFEGVGVFTFENEILCVLPKYHSIIAPTDDDLLSYTSLLIRLLRKYGLSSRNSDGVDLSKSETEVFFSELSIANEILTDYVQDGLLTQDIDEIRISDNGEVDWDSTIANLHPVFSLNSPVYFETYRFGQFTEEFSLVQEVQKWFVKHFMQKYGRILSYTFTIDFDAVSDLGQLGSEAFILQSLRSELGLVYHDRKINLIKLLIASTQRIFSRDSYGPSMYATRDFSPVWEQALGVAFNNQREAYKNSIPNPIWHDLSHQSEPKESFRPDLITQSPEDKSIVFILDAKYYSIRYSSGAKPLVTNNPGLSDVSKQFLYEVALESLRTSKLFNGFAFPSDSKSEFEVFGYVTLDLFPGKRIWLLYLSEILVFESYLTNRALLESKLVAIQKAIESH